MICIKCGMASEASVAKAYAAKETLVLDGILTLDALQAAVPQDCEAIISFGLCGGLRPELPVVGQTLIATRLVTPTEIYVADQPWVKRLFAATKNYAQPYFSSGVFNQADTPEQRAALWEKYGAWVIDDESFFVAQFAQARKIPFAVMRTVSDAWDDNVAITANLLNSSGGVDLLAAIGAIVEDPGDMLRIWRDYNVSISELATAAALVGLNFCWPRDETSEIRYKGESPRRIGSDKMTATDQDYEVGTAAATDILQSDINTLVPSWARGAIPANEAQQLAGPIAKKIIDAVDTYRASMVPRPAN